MKRPLDLLDVETGIADVMKPGLSIARQAAAHETRECGRGPGGSALHSGVARKIAASTSDLVAPVNAVLPVSISNTIAPNAHISERRVTSSPRACSGLM